MNAYFTGLGFAADPDHWLRHVLSIHFDPANGAPYWLERQKSLGIDVRIEVATVDDLDLLDDMDEEDLRTRPIEDFLPKSIDKRSLVLCETGGTTGQAKVTAYTREEFLNAFPRFYGHAAKHRNFPEGLNWLFIGPTGPHIIGRAAVEIAREMGSMEPFTIDFDPRWIKKQVPGSAGFVRYREHLLEQAMAVVKTQNIGILFATPPILEGLAERMSPDARMRIKGIHIGGMSMTAEQYRRFCEEIFPNAVIIPGYGNTLFGLCMEVERNADYHIDYFSPGPRHLLRVCREDGSTVNYGEEGRVVCTRLDESFFIANFAERDRAVRIPASEAAKDLGLHLDGVRDPRPMAEAATVMREGLY